MFSKIKALFGIGNKEEDDHSSTSSSFSSEEVQQTSEKHRNSVTLSTSQKHRTFVAEPMGEKKVTELAGIGPALGGRLTEKGYSKASTVLGKFLIFRKDEKLQAMATTDV